MRGFLGTVEYDESEDSEEEEDELSEGIAGEVLSGADKMSERPCGIE